MSCCCRLLQYIFVVGGDDDGTCELLLTTGDCLQQATMNWDTIVLSTIPYPLVGVGNVSVDIGKSNPLNSSTNTVLVWWSCCN